MNAREATEQAAEALAAYWRDTYRQYRDHVKEHHLRDVGNQDRERAAVDNLFEAVDAANDISVRWFSAALAYLATKVDLEADPDVRTEIIGRTVKVIVSVHDTWVGTLTTHTCGGDEACVTRMPLAWGTTVDINPELAARHLCFNPAHKTREQGV